jgi:phosphatidylinositol alpha-1,6-mannosyltransferase
MRPIARRALVSADLVLTNSEHTLLKMRQTLGRDDVGIACPLGLPARFAALAEPPSALERASVREGLTLEAADGVFRAIGSRMMLIVGRLDAGEREKGHRELIAVMPALLALVPEAELVIVGGGSDEGTLRRLARESTAASAIYLTGRVTDALLDRLYRAAYAYVMPSRQEGFGLVYVEAMSRGLACVACRDDGGAEVVVEGETGLLVRQPIEQGALVDVLVRLLNDSTTAQRMGLAGWRRVRQLYTAEAHQVRLIELLRTLAQS